MSTYFVGAFLLEEDMSKDDYHVIVYQILAYLYVKLKEGEKPDPEMLKPGSRYLEINESYWQYIMEHLYQDGYITGITKKAWGNEVLICDLESCQITPKGIGYLCDNSFLQKAKEFLKEVKAIVPFT